MMIHRTTIRAAVPAHPATRRAGRASWRRMLSASPPSSWGSARVAQSTFSGSAASWGRVAGGAGRVRMPTELEEGGEYSIEAPRVPTGSGAGGAGGGAGCEEAIGGVGAGGGD